MQNLKKNKFGTRSDASIRLETARKVLWNRDESWLEESISDDYSECISLSEGGSVRRPHVSVLVAIQDAILNPSLLNPEIYLFNRVCNELLEEVVCFFKQDCSIEWAKKENVCIGAGSSHILDALLSIVIMPGDYVLGSTPFYHAFADFPEKWGGIFEGVETKAENGHKLTAEDLKRWLQKEGNSQKKVSCLILTSPNTVGAVYTQNELESLSAVIKELEIATFVDEVYRDCIFEHNEMISLGSLPDMDKYVVTAHSGSKTRGVADFRVGWACGPNELISKIVHCIEHSVTLVPLLMQRMAVAVLNIPRQYIAIDNNECEARARLIKACVENINDIAVSLLDPKEKKALIKVPYVPRAGHAVMIDFSGLKGWKLPDSGKIENDLDVTKYFMNLTGIAKDGSRRRQGVIFAPCYSNGLNSFCVRASFADVGHKHTHVSIKNEVRHLYYEFLKQHSTVIGLGASASLDLHHIDTVLEDDEIYIDGFMKGRKIIEEAFRRVLVGILELIKFQSLSENSATTDKNLYA
jgi:aspartate/methionine/tyrosine aminotransferase